MADEKASIARRAAELIPDSSSLFINIGTTTERVAEYLVDRQGMLVITNNITVASTLWPPGLEVMIAGGTVRHSDGGIVGSSAEEFIGNFNRDYAIIGCSSIDQNGEIFDYDGGDTLDYRARPIRNPGSRFNEIERRAPVLDI